MELQWIIPTTEMYNMHDMEKKTECLKSELNRSFLYTTTTNYFLL